MLTAQAHIDTETPGRYLVRLSEHANSIRQKSPFPHTNDGGAHPEVQRVERTDTDATLVLSVGRCSLHASGDTLTVRVEADTEQDLRQIQELIARDLERFGRREELTVIWTG